MRKLGLGLGSLILVVTMVLVYPVGGVIWQANQVQRLALVAGENRQEAEGMAAIREALAGARTDRLMAPLRALFGRTCAPQDVEFLTEAGWVPVRINCAGGFFLDFMPRPGAG